MRFTLSCLALLVSPCVFAGPGITPTEIKLGQTAVFEGPASALGLGMRTGLQTAFAEINDQGGVVGRKITLVTKDDGYEPTQAIANARALIQDEKAFLLIGGVGTPTASAIIPVCQEAQVPFIAPFTGAGALRNPVNPLIINLRASYGQEMERLAALLVDERKVSKIACFYQNDGYGQAGLKGIETALTKRNLTLTATGTYERNTTAVKTALLDIRKAAPEAIIMVGTYKACAEFIKLARKLGLKDTLYCNISFVGTRALQSELGAEGEGVIISQVVPDPTETNPATKAYRAALAKYQPAAAPDWVSLEGYLAGRLFIDAAKAAGTDLTREKFLAAVATLKNHDLGGLTVNYGPGDTQGADTVYLTQIKDGAIIPLP